MNISTIGIIGYGDFGKLIAQIANIFYTDIKVKFYSRSQNIDNKIFFELDEVCQTDLLFVSVPISVFEKNIENIANQVGQNTIIVDVCTIKKYSYEILKKYNSQIKYICTHPMFGPYSFAKIGNKLDNLRIVLCEHNLDNEVYDQIKYILNQMKLKVLEMTADKHDEKIARTLFLTHLIGQVLSEGGFERTDIDTVSFGFVMDAVESVKQDKQLFKDVYNYNPYCQKVLEEFKITTSHIEKYLDK